MLAREFFPRAMAEKRRTGRKLGLVADGKNRHAHAGPLGLRGVLG